MDVYKLQPFPDSEIVMVDGKFGDDLFQHWKAPLDVERRVHCPSHFCVLEHLSHSFPPVLGDRFGVD